MDNIKKQNEFWPITIR